MRRFVLLRHEDITGLSGTGVIAEGVEFSDGSVALRWPSHRPSTVMWESVNDALCIHGHNGRTVIRWIDPFDSDAPERAASSRL